MCNFIGLVRYRYFDYKLVNLGKLTRKILLQIHVFSSVREFLFT